MGERLILVFVGALAYRGAASLSHALMHYGVNEVPLFFGGPAGRNVLSLYVIGGLPLAFLNGFLLKLSVLDAGLVGIGTWLAMLACNLFLRFNPALQFLIFGSANLVWTAVNIVRALTRLSR